MEYTGKVDKRRVAAGSKSEHEAVVISTDAGVFALRRHGGNAFQDDELDQLVGKQVVCNGTVHGQTLIVSDVKEVG